MNVHLHYQHSIAVVAVEGNLFANSDAIPLCTTFRDLVDKGSCRAILDLSKVTWTSIAGTGLLISALTSFRNHGGDLKFACASPDIKEQLFKASFDRICEFFESVDVAVIATL